MDNNYIISFIFCVNNDILLENSLRFISQLTIPKGYSIEIIQIRNANSLASAYNEGIKKATGKYKIYLHQDVYIINPNFLNNIIDIFTDNKIGLIGFAGSKEIPSSLVWWEASNLFGELYEIRNSHLTLLSFQSPKNKYEEVSLLDGFILITQFDIPWREDILDGWHFYDISQSLEFLKQNKKIVIPQQNTPWLIHDCGDVSTENYYFYRDKVLAEYFIHSSSNINSSNDKDTGTSIIVLSYNNLNYTKQCIESIRKYSSNENYEIIVIDNNSNEETKNWLKNQYDIKLQLNTSNRGFPGGCNDGIKLANPKNDILLLNNDIVVTSNWLTNLRTALYSNENIGAVSPITNSSSYWQSIPINYKTIDEMQDFASKINISNKANWEERIMLVGYSLLIKRSVLNKVGLLDEIYFPGNFEDDDYCLRIITAGYKLLLCRDTFVHHYGSASFSENSSYSKVLKENQEKFEKKWGIDIKEVHFNLAYLNLVPEIENLKILDVYGNCGVNGLMLKFYRKNLDFYIGYSSNGSYKIANKLFKTFSIDSNNIDFDYILINNGDKFLTDVMAKSLVFKALESAKNIAIFISSTLYTDSNAENANNLSLFHDYLTKFNFIINSKFSYGDSIINFYIKK